jgi:hypothetical protein
MGGSDGVLYAVNLRIRGIYYTFLPQPERVRVQYHLHVLRRQDHEVRLLVGDEPIQYGGFKLFYRQDEPLLSPEQVLALDPASVVINYQ